jgi:hypothetical protein
VQRRGDPRIAYQHPGDCHVVSLLAMTGKLVIFIEQNPHLGYHFNEFGQMCVKEVIKKGNIFFLLFLLSLPLSVSSDDTNLLKVRVSIIPGRLAKGQQGNVQLRFTVEEGVTISPHPSFTIELSPSKELIFPKYFFTASDLNIEILEEDGQEYLNLTETIKIPFTVSLEAKRGNHILKGKVKYFARLKEGKSGLKTSSKFSVSFYTSNRIVKKKK